MQGSCGATVFDCAGHSLLGPNKVLSLTVRGTEARLCICIVSALVRGGGRGERAETADRNDSEVYALQAMSIICWVASATE